MRRGAAEQAANDVVDETKRSSVEKPPILTAQALRKAARAHSRAALEALAEVARGGDSPASRISAASAILDRAFGKSRAEAAAAERDRPRPKLDREFENVIVYPPAHGWDED